MMDAQETVISGHYTTGELTRLIAQANATYEAIWPIAFQAGYQQCKKESDEALIILEKEIKERLDEERKAGLEQGREEAVELIKRYFDILPLASKRRIQAQLKEWGI